jgi:predicted lipid-binding transport protein (Tim44 family)
MGSSGGFPLDLILFGAIAAFLVLRLRSILGKRTGYERPQMRPAGPGTGRVIDLAPEVPAKPSRALPDPASPPGQALARMARLEAGFDAARFLDGAEAAFRIIVTAFAAGDRDKLRVLLSDDTFRAFDSAISGRETAQETQRTEIRAVSAATIEAADLRGSIADIAVRFVSDQVNLTLGPDGNPVTGTDAVTEIVDQWTFERDLASSDPTWRLVAARSA